MRRAEPGDSHPIINEWQLSVQVREVLSQSMVCHRKLGSRERLRVITGLH
jgi:hypothetical protein